MAGAAGDRGQQSRGQRGGPGGGRRRRWLGGVLVAVLPAAALATVVLPGAAGLSGRWPWVAVIAFRGILGALTLAVAVPLALLALATRRHRRVVTVFLSLTTVAVLAAAGQLVVLAVRGLTPVSPVGAAPAGGLTVVVTNTDHSAADPAALSRLFLDAGADVVAMPETDSTLARDVATRLAAAGHPVQVFGVPAQGRITPTSLLVSDRLGRYQQVNSDGKNFGVVVAEPVGGTGHEGRPTFVAVHPQAPVSPTLTRVWRVGTTSAVAACRNSPDVVLGGDFNSNVDHPALRSLGSCFDAAQEAGAAGVATWPQGLPRILGAPLDHVVATRSRWHPVAVWVAPIPGSDHRALLTRLLPVATVGVGTTDVQTWSHA